MEECPPGESRLNSTGPEVMRMPWLEGFDSTLLYSSLAGAAGGCTTFVHGLTMGNYRNETYPRKLSLIIIGEKTFALFFSLAFSSLAGPYRLFLSFAIGLAWVRVVQQLRKRVTAIINAALGPLNDPADESRTREED
jgi:hypothetical protein